MPALTDREKRAKDREAKKKADADAKLLEDKKKEAVKPKKPTPKATGKGKIPEVIKVGSEETETSKGSSEKLEDPNLLSPQLTTILQMARNRISDETAIEMVVAEWRKRGFPETGFYIQMCTRWNSLVEELNSQAPPTTSEVASSAAQGGSPKALQQVKAGEKRSRDSHEVMDLTGLDIEPFTTFTTESGAVVLNRQQRVGLHVPKDGYSTCKGVRAVGLHPQAETITPIGRLCRSEHAKSFSNYLSHLDSIFALSQNNKVLQFSAEFCDMIDGPPAGVEKYWELMKKSPFYTAFRRTKSLLTTAASSGGYSGPDAQALYETAVIVAVIGATQKSLDKLPQGRGDALGRGVLDLVDKANTMLDLKQQLAISSAAEEQAFLRNAMGDTTANTEATYMDANQHGMVGSQAPHGTQVTPSIPQPQTASQNQQEGQWVAMAQPGGQMVYVHIPQAGGGPVVDTRGQSVMVGWDGANQPSPAPFRHGLDARQVQGMIANAINRFPTPAPPGARTTMAAPTGSPAFGKNENGEAICFSCQKTGHIKRNCPGK